MKYQCISCRSELTLPKEGGGFSCAVCGVNYEASDNFLWCETDTILYKEFKEKFLLNKVLNNNGYLSYQLLPSGSVSLAGREDVKQFRDYIAKYVPEGKMLDIGCGALPLPGYLDFSDKTKYQLFGLDPISDKSFMGTRIVGCSEFTPFFDQTFDALIFATSMDHVCSLKKTISETYRVLKKGGRVVIWMSDRSRHISLKNLFVDLMAWLKIRLRLAGILNPNYLYHTKDCYNVGRFVIYPNKTVLYVPKGAVDPFHSFYESPKEIVRLMEKEGFRSVDISYHNSNQVFLCFDK